MSDSLLKISQASARVGFGRNAIYERLNPNHPRFDPTFPKPVNLPGTNQIRFVSTEVDAWIAAQIARRDEKLSQGQRGAEARPDARGAKSPAPAPTSSSEIAP